MSSEEEAETEELNPHNPAPLPEKVWLPVYLDEEGKLAKHDWCLDTGIIKNQGGEEAKPKGFYILVLNKMRYILKSDLGHARSAPKLPESHELFTIVSVISSFNLSIVILLSQSISS